MNEGWKCVFTALEPLTEDDLGGPSPFVESRTRCYKQSSGSSRTTPITSGRWVLAKHFQSAQWNRFPSREANLRNQPPGECRSEAGQEADCDREVRPTGGR